jgi:beta-glucosidase
MGCIGFKCELLPCTKATIAHAVAVAKQSTHVVIALGITGLESEGSGGDRVSIDLPADQRALTTAILALGKPTAIVMINGGAVSLAEEQAAGAAILEAFLPGKHGAAAVADVILGHVSPAGRLPYTVYAKSFVNETAMTEMDPTKSPGRTYRYFSGEPLFPFGHGLTFSSFELLKGTGWPQRSTIAAASTASESLKFTVEVHNTGKADSDVVVTAYWRIVGSGAGTITPIRKQLFDYERVAQVKAGPFSKVGATVVFEVSALSFVLVAANGDLVSAPATYEVSIDDGSGGVALTERVTVTGARPVLVEPFPKY